MSKVWRYIDETDVSASYGLATDEYLMNPIKAKNNYKATLRLYTYKNYSALCGRFQDINAEINIDSCKNHGFQFGRRLTGGGAIIMGKEQLGICIASHTSAFQFEDIRHLYGIMADPVIQFLNNMGIEAKFRAKNDIEVAGKKIAGLGIYIDEKGAFQFHCSLLLDLDINEMLKVLNIPIQKYADNRLIQAIEQRITTIRKESGINLAMDILKNLISLSYSLHNGIFLTPEVISDDEKVEIEKIEQERYLYNDWIFQRSRQEDMTGMSLVKTPTGLIRTYVGLKGENIKNVLITGDFMEADEKLKQVESELKWSPLDKENIDSIVNKVLKEDSTLNRNFISEGIWMAAQRAMAANRYTYKGSCYYPKEDTTEKNSTTEINEA